MPTRWNAFRAPTDDAASWLSKNYGTFATREAARDALLDQIERDVDVNRRHGRPTAGMIQAFGFFMMHPGANEFAGDYVKYSIQKVTTSYLP